MTARETARAWNLARRSAVRLYARACDNTGLWDTRTLGLCHPVILATLYSVASASYREIVPPAERPFFLHLRRAAAEAERPMLEKLWAERDAARGGVV